MKLSVVTPATQQVSETTSCLHTIARGLSQRTTLPSAMTTTCESFRKSLDSVLNQEKTAEGVSHDSMYFDESIFQFVSDAENDVDHVRKNARDIGRMKIEKSVGGQSEKKIKKRECERGYDYEAHG